MIGDELTIGDELMAGEPETGELIAGGLVTGKLELGKLELGKLVTGFADLTTSIDLAVAGVPLDL